MSQKSYVHDPEGTDTAIRNDEQVADADVDWRGWALVGVVVLSFLVIPTLIVVNSVFLVQKLPFDSFFSMLVLPMIPAALLGATAVWAAIRRRQ